MKSLFESCVSENIELSTGSGCSPTYGDAEWTVSISIQLPKADLVVKGDFVRGQWRFWLIGGILGEVCGRSQVLKININLRTWASVAALFDARDPTGWNISSEMSFSVVCLLIAALGSLRLCFILRESRQMHVETTSKTVPRTACEASDEWR